MLEVFIIEGIPIQWTVCLNDMNCHIKEETGHKTAVRKYHYMCVHTVKLPVMA